MNVAPLMCRLALATVVWTLLVVPDARAECPTSKTNPNARLDMAALDAKLIRGELDPEPLRGKLIRGTQDVVSFQPSVTLDRRRFLVPWTQCKLDYGCTGHISIVEVKRNGEAKQVARSILPFWVDARDEEGVLIELIGLVDMNLDDEKDIVVQYRVREDVLGTKDKDKRYRVFLGIWNSNNLRLRWVDEKDQHGHDDPRDWNCEGTVWRKDVNCDGRVDVSIERHCMLHACRKDTGERVACERRDNKSNFKYVADNDYYLGFGQTDTIGRAEDAHRYVVVAGNVPVSSSNYEERATKIVAKLREAGFDDALTYNSRTYGKMRCCFRTVVVGRYEKKEDAEKRVKELKDKKFRAYMHRAH